MSESRNPLPVERISRAAPPEHRNARHAARLVVDPAQHAAQSPFLLLAEDWFAPPAGFPTHPHRGIETVTFVLEGELQHRDHTGAEGNLSAGDAQFMTAGSGVLHSEMPGPSGVHSLQLWLNLPAAKKGVAPGYKDVVRGSTERIPFEGGTMWLYCGKMAGKSRPFVSQWPLTLVDLELAAGAAVDLEVPAHHRAFAYVIKGKLADFDVAKAEAGNIVWFATSDENGGTARIAASGEEPVRVLFYAAERIDEAVVFGGPFVMNTEAEIRQALQDYERGQLVA